jgi:polyhydroxybutyrate depolymerase
MRPRLTSVAVGAALLCVFLGVTGSGSRAIAAPADPANGSSVAVSIVVGTAERHFTLFVPAVPAARPGLLVMMHGRSGTGAGFEANTGLDYVGAGAGHYVAYPDGLDGSWNSGPCCSPANATGVDDVAFIDALIGWVRTAYPVDGTRILVGGFSNGGMMAFRYACFGHQQIYDLVADASFALTGGCARPMPVHVLAFNGLADQVVLWSSPNVSSLFSTPQPSAAAGNQAFGVSEGCRSLKTNVDAVTGNKLITSANCPVGVSFDQYVVPHMDHRWPAGAQSATKYGINATETLSTWLAVQWPAA